MNITVGCQIPGASQPKIQREVKCESHPSLFRLTKSESTVLELLWDYGNMTQDEINQKAQELESIAHTWKPRSIFALLNDLIRRGFVKTTGMKRAGKTQARVFAPAMSRPEYYAALVQANMSSVELDCFVSIVEESCGH